MGFLGLFKPSGDTIKGTMEGAGSLAKDIRTAITGKPDPETVLALVPKVWELEAKVREVNGQLLLADANGQGWFQRNWRPMVIFGLFVLIVMDSCGLLVNSLPSDAWDVIKIAVGAVAIGQSAEVVADKWNKS